MTEEQSELIAMIALWIFAGIFYVGLPIVLAVMIYFLGSSLVQ